jgi:PAS domain S-box-containing protein
MTSDTSRPAAVETLLLVDDDTAALQVLSNTLADRGLRLLVAGSGDDALQVAAKERPALVLLDILMPGMDGYEVCRRLMADPDTRGSAVIFLSALDESRDKVKGLALGAVDYITKPFDSAEVLARVETHLTIHRLRRRLAQRNEELESENRYILQSMGEGLYCLDAQGTVTYANPAAARLTGWSVEELAGRSLDSLYDPIGEDSADGCSIPRTLSSGESCQGTEKTFLARGGRTFPVECSCTPLLAGQRTLGAVVVFRDISERKAGEAVVKQALKKVERLRDRLQAEKLYLMDEIRGEQHFGEIVGDSPALREVLAQVGRVAPTDTSVLIEGESGTGKESIARAVHDLSPRRDRPLIKVNCAAISPGLVESELFGHEKGAFTGAHRAHIGHFELADGGSLFLDEFGELPAAVQVKLLRVLQDGEFQRVGAERVQKVDVRVIAATNRNLRAMVDAGEFRLDLYYRMSVFPLTVPPLRERTGDIPLLVSAFLTRLEGKLGRRFDGVSQRAMQRLVAYAWPGNIRELQNVIERAAILSPGPVVDVGDPLLESPGASLAAEVDLDRESVPGGTDGDRLATLAEAERAHILKALDATSGVVGGRSGAAALLDLPDSTLRSRMKKLGIGKDGK